MRTPSFTDRLRLRGSRGARHEGGCEKQVFECQKTSSWSSLDAEIGVQLAGVGVEIGVGDHVHHPALLDHVVPVRDSRGEMEVLLDQNDRETLRLQAGDRASDIIDDDGRQALGGLVEEQEPRAGAQDPARWRASAALRPKASCPGSSGAP